MSGELHKRFTDVITRFYLKQVNLIEAEADAVCASLLKYKNRVLVNESFREFTSDKHLANLEMEYKIVEFKHFKTKYIMDTIRGINTPWILDDNPCIICMDHHTIKVRIIGCHHMVCERCIRKLLDMHRNHTTACPMCRQIIMGFECYDSDTMTMKCIRI